MDKTKELQQRIKVSILYLYDNMSITTFYAGAALGFDALAAETVIDQRAGRARTSGW